MIEANNNTLTIFYDSTCPLCSLEMQKLKQHDNNHKITLVSLQQDDFKLAHPEINADKAMRILHGLYQGQILLGLQVTHRAWTLVGKGIYVAPLNFPVIKQVSHLAYLVIAKYRQPISSFLYRHFNIGKKICDKGVCYDKNNNTDHWRK